MLGEQRLRGWSRGWSGHGRRQDESMQRAGTPGLVGQEGLDFVFSVTRNQQRA